MGCEDDYDKDCGTDSCPENDNGQCELSKDDGYDCDNCPNHTDPE